jgi:hypothetical protein
VPQGGIGVGLGTRERNANADGNVEDGDQAPSRGRCFLATAVTQEDAELVVTESGHRITRADRGSQAFCDPSNELVAFISVELKQQDRYLVTGAVSRRDRVADPVPEQGAIRQPGQLVMQGIRENRHKASIGNKQDALECSNDASVRLTWLLEPGEGFGELADRGGLRFAGGLPLEGAGLLRDGRVEGIACLFGRGR